MNLPQSNIIDQIADQRDELRDENVRLKDRIKRLEGIIERATTAFFVDGSYKSTSVAMLMILGESNRPPGPDSNQPKP